MVTTRADGNFMNGLLKCGLLERGGGERTTGGMRSRAGHRKRGECDGPAGYGLDVGTERRARQALAGPMLPIAGKWFNGLARLEGGNHHLVAAGELRYALCSAECTPRPAGCWCGHCDEWFRSQDPVGGHRQERARWDIPDDGCDHPARRLHRQARVRADRGRRARRRAHDHVGWPRHRSAFRASGSTGCVPRVGR